MVGRQRKGEAGAYVLHKYFALKLFPELISGYISYYWELYILLTYTLLNKSLHHWIGPYISTIAQCTTLLQQYFHLLITLNKSLQLIKVAMEGVNIISFNAFANCLQ